LAVRRQRDNGNFSRARMDAPRLQCRAEGCENSITAATAARTDGYCAPCHGKLVRARRDTHVRENRKDVDPFAGISDTAEILRIAHQDRPHDPLINYAPPPRRIEELYGSLTHAQGKELMAFAEQSLRSGNTRVAEEIATHLAAFTAYSLDDMLETWLKLGRFWPAIAFRGAGEGICRDLLSHLRPTRSLWSRFKMKEVNADHALQAAAWIGTDLVIEAYQRFDAEPPAWARGLHIRPSQYAQTAGWELCRGERRELTVKRCVSIVPASQTETCADIKLFERRNDTCVRCGSHIVNLLTISRKSAPGLAIGLTSDKLEVTTCPVCTCFGTMFGQLDAGGNGRVVRYSGTQRVVRDDWASSPWSEVPIELVERPAIYAADMSLPTTHTKIGGLPSWVQDSDYPTCPMCSETMIFIAQIDQGDFSGHEGVYYAFFCRDCRTTATTYQQT
jgi:hypothetical protein